MRIPQPTLISNLKHIALRTLAVALLAGVATNAATAQVVFDDANGNASDDGSAPTELVFGIGSNIVNGTVTSPANTRNFYTFTIGAGEELAAINLNSINVTIADPSGPIDSINPGFFALVTGNTSADPGQTAFESLGGALFAPGNLGDNLLDIISAGESGPNTSGTGFTTIGEGDYTFVIQQTGSENSNFSLDFQVTTAVPEPTAGILLAGLGLAGIARRRRR